MEDVVCPTDLVKYVGEKKRVYEAAACEAGYPGQSLVEIQYGEIGAQSLLRADPGGPRSGL